MKRMLFVGAALAVSSAAVLATSIGLAAAARQPIPPPPHYGPVFVSIADVTATEGAVVPMKISLSWTMPIPVEVYWETAPASATAPRDYVYQHGAAVIPAGKLSATCLVSSVNDTMYEPNRSFKVHLWADNSLVRFSRDTATYTIVDNDPVPTAHIGDQAPSWVYEGGDLTWTVSLTNPSYLPVDVHLDGGANVWTTLLPADYDGAIPTAVHFAPGEVTKSFTIHTHENITDHYKVMWIWMTGVTNGLMPAHDYGDPADQVDCWGYGTVWDDAF